ncbi:13606_t:CDS:2 [Ambispora gerdemannii]|uniref:13606_t:CDS:1 n=1 Tax=Ambispora gerdemannii TaxID=144530 RepID=A0A9N8ZH48_9GLOM|nr:13606_t:CDS:2 [Ambispora gerdemannii]
MKEVFYSRSLYDYEIWQNHYMLTMTRWIRQPTNNTPLTETWQPNNELALPKTLPSCSNPYPNLSRSPTPNKFIKCSCF